MTNQISMFDSASVDNSLQGFVNNEVSRMRPGDTHRKRSMAHMTRFIEFSDN